MCQAIVLSFASSLSQLPSTPLSDAVVHFVSFVINVQYFFICEAAIIKITVAVMKVMFFATEGVYFFPINKKYIVVAVRSVRVLVKKKERDPTKCS